MDKSTKLKLKDEYVSSFGKITAAFVAEYRGLTVAELSELRRSLRKVDATFTVLKNRVAIKAIEGTKEAELKGILKGPVGIIQAFGDAAQVAKVVSDFEKSNEKFKISGGLLEQKFVAASDVKVIASLPSKEVLIAQILGLLLSSHRNILGVVNAVPRSLVQVINAIKEKKA